MHDLHVGVLVLLHSYASVCYCKWLFTTWIVCNLFQRVNQKKVEEQIFYRLVQFFAICLFESKEEEDYVPAKHLMNMCFTFYFEGNFFSITNYSNLEHLFLKRHYRYVGFECCIFSTAKILYHEKGNIFSDDWRVLQNWFKTAIGKSHCPHKSWWGQNL